MGDKILQELGPLFWVNAQQAKSVYKHNITTESLLKINAVIWTNKMCKDVYPNKWKKILKDFTMHFI
jgi:hypothetical protein